MVRSVGGTGFWVWELPSQQTTTRLRSRVDNNYLHTPTAGIKERRVLETNEYSVREPQGTRAVSPRVPPPGNIRCRNRDRDGGRVIRTQRDDDTPSAN